MLIPDPKLSKDKRVTDLERHLLNKYPHLRLTIIDKSGDGGSCSCYKVNYHGQEAGLKVNFETNEGIE